MFHFHNENVEWGWDTEDTLPLATAPFPPFPSELDPLSERGPGLLLSRLLFLFPVLQPWTAPFARQKKKNLHELFWEDNTLARQFQPKRGNDGETYRLYEFAVLD